MRHKGDSGWRIMLDNNINIRILRYLCYKTSEIVMIKPEPETVRSMKLRLRTRKLASLFDRLVN